MNGSELNKQLAHFPVEQRAEAREFAIMDLDAKLLWLYRESRQARAQMDRLRESTSIRPHLLQAGYTTLLVVTAIASLVTGVVPELP